MTKSVRMMRDNLALVDVIIELLDARIPRSSQNPDIGELARGKRRIIVLNKADMACLEANKAWENHFIAKGLAAACADSSSGNGLDKVRALAEAAVADKLERQRARGRLSGRVRAMVLGVPNVGKSTFINRLVGRPVAKAEDRPGVTRAKQWVRVIPGFELLDTPGILWPRFENEDVGLNLAITGAIVSRILQTQELALRLIEMLMALDNQCLRRRYKIDIPPDEEADSLKILHGIAKARGMLLKGGQLDMERAAVMLLDEFRGGKLGRLTLEASASI